MKIQNLTRIIFVGLIVIISACSAIQSLNIFPVQQDVGLGNQFALELQKSPKDYPLYNNPKLKEYITLNILQPILQSPAIQYKSIFNYEMDFVKNDSILNAFAVPGGHIYVYTGLLKYLDSEAALAGVLAHEIAHAERRHATSRMTKAYGLAMIQNLVLGNNASETSQLIANALGQGILLKNSRDDEDQSDEYSIQYLRSTKFYPGAVKFFFEKMRDDGKIERGGNGIATFLSTHPDPIDRISSAESRIKALGLEIKTYRSTGAGIFKTEYKKNILDKLK
jgi:beta-barrel assembly-enhancing protease